MKTQFLGCVALIYIQGGTFCTVTLHEEGLTDIQYVEKVLNLDFITESKDTMCEKKSYVDTLIPIIKEDDFEHYFKHLNHEAHRQANLTEHPKVTSIRY